MKLKFSITMQTLGNISELSPMLLILDGIINGVSETENHHTTWCNNLQNHNFPIQRVGYVNNLNMRRCGQLKPYNI
jgi:hypothetical protein